MGDIGIRRLLDSFIKKIEHVRTNTTLFAYYKCVNAVSSISNALRFEFRRTMPTLSTSRNMLLFELNRLTPQIQFFVEDRRGHVLKDLIITVPFLYCGLDFVSEIHAEMHVVCFHPVVEGVRINTNAEVVKVDQSYGQLGLPVHICDNSPIQTTIRIPTKLVGALTGCSGNNLLHLEKMCENLLLDRRTLCRRERLLHIRGTRKQVFLVQLSVKRLVCKVDVLGMEHTFKMDYRPNTNEPLYPAVYPSVLNIAACEIIALEWLCSLCFEVGHTQRECPLDIQNLRCRLCARDHGYVDCSLKIWLAD